MMPSSAQRVPSHSPATANERIRGTMEANVAYYAEHPDQIDSRLAELDREWDIERTLEANAASLAFVGTALGVMASRKWLILPAIVGGFLLQHAMQGWCPPVEVFRRLGYRTVREIEAERYALKALRGDFAGVRQAADAVAQAIGATGR